MLFSFFLSFLLSAWGVKFGFSFVKERGFVGMNTVTKIGLWG